MNNLIKRIEIHNFRSIRHQIVECSEYNLFCGINDIGKSNLLKALNLFFNSETDFQTPFNFSSDYNKIALAGAQKSNKQKQQIKIKITFNIPKGYKSLKGKTDFFVEKTFDRNTKRNNAPSQKISEEDSMKRTVISRLINSVRFVYIPALKGENVIQYMLGLLGEYELVQPGQIEGLNKSIQDSTEDLTELLGESNIGIGTTFGLPSLLGDFWQKLSVGTSYEQLENVNNSLEKSAKKKGVRLNPANFLVPLSLRGDGLKSKYIPPLLLWLQKNSTQYTYIWGIDEPENSLEFRAADELSKLFCNKYSLQVQIFATTHSMAFLNPKEDAVIKPRVFRCTKTSLGDTSIRTFHDLFEEENRYVLSEEIGSLQIQTEIIDHYRTRIDSILADNTNLQNQIIATIDQLKEAKKPIVITEGKTDWMHMKAAFARLRGVKKLCFDEYTEDRGDIYIDKMCEMFAKVKGNNKKIFIFDHDNPAMIEKHDGPEGYKDWGNHVYSFCVPVPESRKEYKNVSVEFYYRDEEITKKTEDGKRLFFTNELEETIIKDLSTKKARVQKISIKASPDEGTEFEKKIFDKDVSQIVDQHGRHPAHSKTRFAELILRGQPGFDDFDVSNFRLIYDKIQTILSAKA